MRGIDAGGAWYLRKVHRAQIGLPKPNPDRVQHQRKKMETEPIALMQERDGSDEFMRKR